LKYYFYLADVIGKKLSDGKPRHVPEFLVLFDVMERIAKEYNL